MASSEDFQRVYDLYKQEGIPKQISIVNFCQQHGLVYSQFEKWYKSRRKLSPPSVHQVRIVDKDGLLSSSQETANAGACDRELSPAQETVLRFGITVRTSQGLSLHQNNLTYRQLLHLAEKLEVLC